MSAYRPAVLAGLLPAALLTAPAVGARHRVETQEPSKPQSLLIAQIEGEFFVHAAIGTAPVQQPPISLGKGIMMDAALFGSRYHSARETGQ